MCWSLRRWIMRDDHSNIGMESGENLSNLSRHRAALCFTESIVSLLTYVQCVVTVVIAMSNYLCEKINFCYTVFDI